MRSCPSAPDRVSPFLPPSMQSLPRPPSALSLPPRSRIRSQRFVPVMRLRLLVPTMTNFAPLPFRQGLLNFDRASASDITLPPVGPANGEETTTTRVSPEPPLPL